MLRIADPAGSAGLAWAAAAESVRVEKAEAPASAQAQVAVVSDLAGKQGLGKQGENRD